MWVMDLGTLNANGTAATYPSYGDRNFYDATSTTAAMGSMGIETIQGALVSIDGNSLPQACGNELPSILTKAPCMVSIPIDPIAAVVEVAS